MLFSCSSPANAEFVTSTCLAAILNTLEVVGVEDLRACAWNQPRRQEAPAAADESWTRAFVLAQLEELARRELTSVGEPGIGVMGCLLLMMKQELLLAVQKEEEEGEKRKTLRSRISTTQLSLEDGTGQALSHAQGLEEGAIAGPVPARDGGEGEGEGGLARINNPLHAFTAQAQRSSTISGPMMTSANALLEAGALGASLRNGELSFDDMDVDVADTLESGGQDQDRGIELPDTVNPLYQHTTALNGLGGVGTIPEEEEEEEEEGDSPSWDTVLGGGRRSIEDSVTSQMRRMTLETNTMIQEMGRTQQEQEQGQAQAQATSASNDGVINAAAEPYVRDAQGKWVRRDVHDKAPVRPVNLNRAPSLQPQPQPQPQPQSQSRRESSVAVGMKVSADRRDSNSLPTVLGSFKARNALTRKSVAGGGSGSGPLFRRQSKLDTFDAKGDAAL